MTLRTTDTLLHLLQPFRQQASVLSLDHFLLLKASLTNDWVKIVSSGAMLLSVSVSAGPRNM